MLKHSETDVCFALLCSLKTLQMNRSQKRRDFLFSKGNYVSEGLQPLKYGAEGFKYIFE